MSAPAASSIRFDHQEGAHFLSSPIPRLSWQVHDAPDGATLWATEFELTDDAGTSTVRRIEGAEQVSVDWPFEPLMSRARGSLRIRCLLGPDWTSWSDPVPFECSLLDADDWLARFVSPRSLGRMGDAAPIVERRFTLPAGVVRARLHVTALGLHVTSLNGVRVSDEELAPGWTSYAERLRFRTHNVTSLLRHGDNTLSVLLGNGWYRGKLGSRGERALFGERLAALAQLEVEYEDGSTHVVATDGHWTASTSNVLADDLYDGQTTDLSVSPSEHREPIDLLDESLARLFPAISPPVRRIARLAPVSLHRSPSGKLLIDFGKNIVGWVRLRVSAPAGREVVIRHAEVLENDELGVRPLRSAAATDRWLLAGDGIEVLEPSLTFHGFRYAELSGVDDREIVDIEAVFLSSDLTPTGTFESSDDDLNTLHDNVVRSMRGNFLDLPTDCPQRDERLGWTGDIQIFAPTAAFLTDCSGFLLSWLRDLAAEQQDDGLVPFVIPNTLRNILPAAAAWGDAATVVPWALYESTGDRSILAEQFESMHKWVDAIDRVAGPDHLWTGRFQFGDWLDPAAPPDAPGNARTDKDLVATAHFARSAGIVARAASVLDLSEESARYARLAADIRRAFAEAYVTPSGRMVSDTPTAYAMALVWNLFHSDAQRRGAGRRLADLVRQNGFRIATGFVGTPLITDALTEAGHVGLAYRLLLERECPSWLYPVTMGATTIWERWDSMLPDGSINPGQMTSFNHFALGAVADWLHRTVAGLAAGAPGYRELLVKPLAGGGLTRAAAVHETPYGRASVAWKRDSGRFHLDLTVPFGSEAVVILPGQEPIRMSHGEHSWDVPDETSAVPPVETIRDAVDDQRLWESLVEVMTELGAARDIVAATALASRGFDLPLSELASVILPRGRRDAVDKLAAGFERELGLQVSRGRRGVE